VLPLVLVKLRAMDWSESLYADADDFAAFLRELLQWDGRKRHVREEHELWRAEQGGVVPRWLFEARPTGHAPLDLVLDYPAAGSVRCVDVRPKGELVHVKGRGLIERADCCLAG
jgi:hypothetical protein